LPEEEINFIYLFILFEIILDQAPTLLHGKNSHNPREIKREYK